MAPFAIILALSAAAAAPGSWQRTGTGLVVHPASGPEAEVRLSVYGDRIVRVTALPAAGAEPAPSLMVTAQPAHAGFTVREAAGHVVLSTARRLGRRRSRRRARGLPRRGGAAAARGEPARRSSRR